MKIIVDAFGGDNAPGEILLGCAQARKELGVDLVLTGDREKLLGCARSWGWRRTWRGWRFWTAPGC